MDFENTPRSNDFTERVQRFIDAEIRPADKDIRRELAESHHGGEFKSWRVPKRVEELKAKARAAGLWNLFLPDAEHGAGLSTLEYAPVAEASGHHPLAAEIFNCSAPDTGNMELLHRFGTPEQKAKWLKPLLAGEARSVIGMTEPDVASSDPSGLQTTAVVHGSEVVVNGRKWWSSGAGHPNARFAIVMARTPNEKLGRHEQHSMVIVPLDAKGVTIERMVPVFGTYDEPHGHGEVRFDSVRVPADNLVGGPGKGFQLAQERLGPGRIHHCMRCIGAAEEALSLMVKRGLGRSAFGKPLLELGGNRERIADARIAIEQARLLVLHAAWKLDELGPLGAMGPVSAIKVAVPNMLQVVVDMAIQMHGGAGLSDDTPLTAFFAQARALRIADGPDEVHRRVIARIEVSKHEASATPHPSPPPRSGGGRP